MGKTRNYKIRMLNKITKHQKQHPANETNKIHKKKQNLEKKVTFKKEVLLKEAVKDETVVKKISRTESLLKNLFKNPANTKTNKTQEKQPKIKSVEKHKKRQKTQINDTKLLLKLMKVKK